MSGDEKASRVEEPHDERGAAEAAAQTPQSSDDQQPYEFGYNHARMPFFMKLVWVAFLVFATYYVVVYLLTSLGNELGS